MMERFDRFFFEQRIDLERLGVFRFFLFFLVCLESWDQVVHAPRYGAGAFNVAHFAWMQDLLPLPTREFALVSYLLQLLLAIRLAVGVGRRIDAALLAGLYGVTYFWSQLDSYQHHYLMFLLITLTAFLPLDEARVANKPFGPPPEPVRTGGWALKLMLVQVSIVYLYTAWTKTDADWVDGSTLYRFTQGWVHDWVKDVAVPMGLDPTDVWAWMAISVIFQQIFLAIAIHIPRLHWLAVLVAIAFHGTLEVWGFKIGWFSYYMFTIYLLLLPDKVWAVVAVPFRLVADTISGGAQLVAEPTEGLPSPGFLGLWLAVMVGALAALMTVPLPHMALVFGISAGVLVALEIYRMRRGVGGLPGRAGGTLFACAIVLIGVDSTEVVKDYWRYLGGDTRRRGDLVSSLQAYETVTGLYPDYQSGHNRVGDLHLRLNHPDEALAAFERSLALGGNTSGYVGRAETLEKLGRCSDAIEDAERALKRDKDNRDARAVLSRCGR